MRTDRKPHEVLYIALLGHIPCFSIIYLRSSIIDMPDFDATPLETQAGGKDDALRTKGSEPTSAPTDVDIAVGYTDERINMEEYERTVPLWKRIWQHSLTQMMLLSVQAFCGPAMADAIAGRSSDTRMPGWITR